MITLQFVQKMPKSQKLFLVLFLLLAICQSSSDFPLINDERTANVKEFCELSREEMIKKYDEQDLTFMKEQTANSFNIDGMDFLQKIFSGQSVEDDLNQNRGTIAVYIGFFAIPFIVIILMSPFLICCCACPNSCPACESCRQPQEKPYTSCEQKYPAIAMIVLTIITIAALITALVYKAPIDKAYNDTFCSVSIVLDDLLNGNVSYNDDTKYWIGTASAETAVRNMNSSFGDISDSMASIGTQSTDIQDLDTEFDEIKVQLDKVPGTTPYEYDSPIDSTVPTGVITSLFPDVLGDSNSTGTLIFNTYSAVQATQRAIIAISQLADAVKAALDQFASALDGIITSLSEINTEINSANDVLAPSNQQLDDATRAVVVVFYIIVILGLVFALLIFISAISVLCCKNYSCRFLAYVACSCLLFFALVYFALAVFFSFATPVTYYSCLYIETGFSTPQNFKTYFGPIIGSENAEIFSACTVSGDGEIVSNLIGNQTISYIYSINELTAEISDFKYVTFENQMSALAKQLVDTTDDYQRARILDVNDATAINALNDIADPASYAACSASQANFAADSWVPSNDQNPVYVSCAISNGKQTSVAQCPSGISSSADDCNGCMDTYNLLESYTLSATVLADLNARYSHADCLSFTTALSNIWNNFYRIKKQVIGAAYDRGVAVQTRIDNVNLLNIGESFGNASTVLATNLGTIADPDVGLIAGLNCKVLSEDVNLAIQTICDSTFAYVFVQRILFAIAGWAIMILACFSVCFGVHSFRMSLIPKDQLYLDKINSSAQIYSAHGM